MPTTGVSSTTMRSASAGPVEDLRVRAELVASLRAVQAIACVAEAGHDEAALVQAAVDGGHDDVHVRVPA